MLNRCKFSVGDHVYQEQSGEMHHGIVLATKSDDDEIDWILTIFNLKFIGTNTDEPFVKDFPSKNWTVVYGASESIVQSALAGTCTTEQSDAPEKVFARVRFLRKNRNFVNQCDLVRANFECVAVWCKTGTFRLLKTTDRINKSLRTVGVVAGVTAVTMVPAITVPSAGLWGMLGFTTQVSLMMVAAPIVVPALLVFAAVSMGLPDFLMAKQKTMKLNQSFARYEAAQQDRVVSDTPVADAPGTPADISI